MLNDHDRGAIRGFLQELAEYEVLEASFPNIKLKLKLCQEWIKRLVDEYEELLQSHIPAPNVGSSVGAIIPLTYGLASSETVFRHVINMLEPFVRPIGETGDQKDDVLRSVYSTCQTAAEKCNHHATSAAQMMFPKSPE